MLLWMAIAGGLTRMMGRHARSESLFYYFRLEDHVRFLAIHMNEAARQRARDLWNTPEFEHAQRQRKKVEALFAELKSRIGLRCLRLRRLKFVQEQFFLAATAQNIKRLVRFLSGLTTAAIPATA
jgi:hypothetical protein